MAIMQVKTLAAIYLCIVHTVYCWCGRERRRGWSNVGQLLMICGVAYMPPCGSKCVRTCIHMSFYRIFLSNPNAHTYVCMYIHTYARMYIHTYARMYMAIEMIGQTVRCFDHKSLIIHIIAI